MTRVTQVKEETYANVKSMTGKLDTQIVPVITGFIGRPVLFDSCKTQIPSVHLFLPSLSPIPFFSSPIFQCYSFYFIVIVSFLCICVSANLIATHSSPYQFYFLLPFPLSYLCSPLPSTHHTGQDDQGRITTMGRGGSDLTATVIGSAAGVDEIQVTPTQVILPCLSAETSVFCLQSLLCRLCVNTRTVVFSIPCSNVNSCFT